MDQVVVRFDLDLVLNCNATYMEEEVHYKTDDGREVVTVNDIHASHHILRTTTSVGVKSKISRSDAPTGTTD